MDESLRPLLESINGLRLEMRASTVAHDRFTRVLAEVFRDFTEELRELRRMHDRVERIEANVAHLEMLAGGAR